MEPLTPEMRRVFLHVLDGASYREAAQLAGWPRGVTRTRVAGLARALQETVGVLDVADDAEPTPDLLAAHRAQYREALEHYVPERAVARRGHREATADDLERVLAAIAKRRRCRERDTAMVLTLFATGAKPAEIAAFEVADYLNRDGTVRARSKLASKVAFNGIARPLYFTNPRTCAAIDAYLAYRRRVGHGAGQDGAYRGLEPASALFLRQDGKPFLQAQQPKVGNTVHNLFHRLLRSTGCRDLSTLSARRAVSSRLRNSGYGLDMIACVLGLKSKDSARRLLPGRDPADADARQVGDVMAELF